jgi:hypothetical protein
MLTLDSNLRYRVVAVGERYHWIDRATNQPLTYKDGSGARFVGLDEAIAAFIDGKLSADRNEVLKDKEAC